jgi:hypothetical protein
MSRCCCNLSSTLLFVFMEFFFKVVDDIISLKYVPHISMVRIGLDELATHLWGSDVMLDG